MHKTILNCIAGSQGEANSQIFNEYEYRIIFFSYFSTNTNKNSIRIFILNEYEYEYYSHWRFLTNTNTNTIRDLNYSNNSKKLLMCFSLYYSQQNLSKLIYTIF